MFTRQRSSRTALLPILAMLFVISTKELTALSIETTAAPVVANTTLSLNNNSSAVTEMKTYRPCGADMDGYCENGQCVYYQDQETPSCRCVPPFEGHRCMTMGPSRSKCYDSRPLTIAFIVGVSMAVFLLVVIIICCLRKRCVKSESKIQV